MSITARLVVDHLTRMKEDRVCLAGLDLETGQRWRPKPSSQGTWRRQDLQPTDQLTIRLGTVLELKIEPRPAPPETEDAIVLGGKLRASGQIPMSDLYEQVERIAEDQLVPIFGSELVASRTGRSSALLPSNSGHCSLGTYRPPPFEIIAARQDGIRVEFSDQELGDLSLSVTDLRLFDAAGAPRLRVISAIGARLRAGWPAVFSVGLSRAFTNSEGQTGHWLQVNNILFPEDIDDHPVLMVS